MKVYEKLGEQTHYETDSDDDADDSDDEWACPRAHSFLGVKPTLAQESERVCQ